MCQYYDDDLSIQIKDGIIFIDFFASHGTYEISDRGIKKKIELINGQSFPMVSDMRSLKTSTREARQRMSEPDAGIGVKAVAIIMNSKVHQIMINFFTKINKRPAPTKVFTNKEDAIKWAQKFLSKD